MTNPSSRHQTLVGALVRHFERVGYTILSASYEKFPKPVRHGRHEPDIVVKDPEGVLHIAEAKMGEDLNAQTTGEQFVDFANRVMVGTNVTVPFHIIIYKEDYIKLLLRLTQLGLSSKIGNRIKVWTI